MSHRIEADQEYEACKTTRVPSESGTYMPNEHRVRIRVIEPPRYPEGGSVGVATIHEDGRLLRRRIIDARQLHESGTTRNGQPRKGGYRLVQHADGTPTREAATR